MIHKTLNLNKYAFLEYMSGRIPAWLENIDNFKHFYESKMLEDKHFFDDLPDIQYNYESRCLHKKDIPTEKVPEGIIDGNEVSKMTRLFYENKFLNVDDLNVFDFDNDNSLSTLSMNKRLDLVKSVIDSNEDYLMYEAPFEYKGFFMKADILLRIDGVTKIIEYKAITAPRVEHAWDIYYQMFILSKNGIDIKSKKFIPYLGLMNNLFVYDASVDWKHQVNLLFLEVNWFLKVKPSSGSHLLEYKEKGIPYKEGYREFILNYDLETIFDEIKRIQELDTMPQEEILSTYHSPRKSKWKMVLMKLKNLPHNTVFEYSGDTTFTFNKKVNLYKIYKNKGDVPNYELVSKSYLTKHPILNSEDIKIDDLEKLWKEDSDKTKRIIEKFFDSSKESFIVSDKLKLFLKDLSIKNIPYYYYDFEAVRFAIPKINGTRPYQQVPYQYSLHILFDGKIIHKQFLAENYSTFYKDIIVAFLNDMFTFGVGKYVAYNNAFEHMVIKEMIKNLEDDSNYKENENKLRQIKENAIDLMIPFKKAWYYDKSFKGSYSIKKTGVHFIPDMDYKELDNIHNGSQSSFECKTWILGSINQDNRIINNWNVLRKDMLKYCEYDTLSMVKIKDALDNKINKL